MITWSEILKVSQGMKGMCAERIKDSVCSLLWAISLSQGLLLPTPLWDLLLGQRYLLGMGKLPK